MGSHGGYVQENMLIRKPADENTANDAVLNDDDTLILPIAANEILIVHVHAFWIAGAGGIQAGFNGPAGTTNIRYCISLYAQGGGSSVAGAVAAWDSVCSGGVNDNGTIMGCLCVENGANAGNIIFRWAQNGANANNTTIYRGSSMVAQRVG